MTTINQRVPFKLIEMPCCHHLFCSVNHRWPSYCPNCGAYVYPTIKGCTLTTDDNATLKYNSDKKG